MAAADAHEIGSGNGHLRLRTTREGMAAKAGHDLELTFADWTGTVALDGADPAGARVEVTVQIDSLRVTGATGGVMPLSDEDRTKVVRDALKTLEAQSHPTATFASTAVEVADPAHGVLVGTLTLRGRSGPFRLRVSKVAEGCWEGTGTVVQTEFGIKPFKGLLGALKLSDPVTVEVRLELGPRT
ncbi:MAG: YceI family protein [Sporichthyaceae bacterium]